MRLSYEEDSLPYRTHPYGGSSLLGLLLAATHALAPPWLSGRRLAAAEHCWNTGSRMGLASVRDQATQRPTPMSPRRSVSWPQMLRSTKSPWDLLSRVPNLVCALAPLRREGCPSVSRGERHRWQLDKDIPAVPSATIATTCAVLILLNVHGKLQTSICFVQTLRTCVTHSPGVAVQLCSRPAI